MALIVDEYILYVWHRKKEDYVQIGASLSSNYEACKKFAEEYSLLLDGDEIFDFSNRHVKVRRITYTDWEVIYE